MDQVQVDIVHFEVLKGRGDALFNTLVPWVIKLRGHPDLDAGQSVFRCLKQPFRRDAHLLARDTGVLDALADLMLIAIGKGSVNVPVAGVQSCLDGFANLVGLGLPGAETDSWDLSTLREERWSVQSSNAVANSYPTVFRVKVFFVHSKSEAIVMGVLLRCFWYE